MFNIVSDEVKEDNTPDFRKCWALGEAYYYVNDYYKTNSAKSKHQDIITKLLTIKNISRNLPIEDEKLNTILDDLLLKDGPKQPKDGSEQNVNDTTPKNSNLTVFLESHLRAGLAGKEPQYEYIFQAAKNCQTLYHDPRSQDSQSSEFLKNLFMFKNLVSNDKITLIRDVVNFWKKDRTYTKRTFPPEVKNRIAGLILGTIDISDILTKWDRVFWVLICYIVVGLGIILVAIFVISLLFKVYQTFFIKAPIVNETANATANATDVKGGNNLTDTLTTVSSLAASIIPALGSAIIIWRKFANWVERRLATQCLTKTLRKRIPESH